MRAEYPDQLDYSGVDLLARTTVGQWGLSMPCARRLKLNIYTSQRRQPSAPTALRHIPHILGPAVFFFLGWFIPCVACLACVCTCQRHTLPVCTHDSGAIASKSTILIPAAPATGAGCAAPVLSRGRVPCQIPHIHTRHCVRIYIHIPAAPTNGSECMALCCRVGACHVKFHIYTSQRQTSVAYTVVLA